MSHFLDRLTYFRRRRDPFSDGHGITTDESRDWEDAYRKRWAADKIVRSTHGVNCTGSCSWKIYVKGGIVTWETQQTDYPRTRPDLPNHEPRGCPRGASFSWYLYSGTRIKYPLIRARLLRAWREARATMAPVAAWRSIVQDADKRASWVTRRGRGGFARAGWDEITEIIAASNAYTIREYGPDRVAGFSPIPAMSMISYAAGSRYLSLLGGSLLSFYDWYCDLPPSSPQTWGEQTDVPESADWYNSGFLLVWGSNIPQTRSPDAHFYTESRYRGTKSVVISPDYSEASKFADLWLHPKQGTDAALALALGHVILREYHVERQVPYFTDYARRYTDYPFLVKLVERDGQFVPDRLVRAADFAGALGEQNNSDWKPVAFDEKSGKVVCPRGSAGFRWGDPGKWSLEEKDGAGNEVRLRLSLDEIKDTVRPVAFPYFGTVAPESFVTTAHDEILVRNVPVKEIEVADGKACVASVFDLFLANYGIDRGFGGHNAASSYDENVPFTPAWAEKVCGVPRNAIIQVAREFATNAEKTEGRSMIILGAGINHWYHMDMSYRGIIALLTMCGCVGKSGGGWSHYVGQEKLRPQTGWLPLAFATDWMRPVRQMNGTSFFYAHSDQWRYESMKISDILSPTAPPGDWSGTMIDYNVRAERMGWLPSAPQIEANPLDLGRSIVESGGDPEKVVPEGLKSGEIKLACQDPDNPKNWPRNIFFWRSNVLGASGKGHEYFLKHLVGSLHGVIGTDDERGGIQKPDEVVWREKAPVGKLDLIVTIDFRMSTTSNYSDIVLPTATWYEKHDLNTSDMHPFIHPLTAAVDPVWECKSDWNIFRTIAKKFSEVAPERQPSEVQHTAIGDILVSVVNDGLHQVSFDDLLANDRDACIRAHLGGFRSAPPWLTINCIVVRTGGRTALIDTGFSDKTPMVGRLIPNLETMGIAAGDIDMVLMTHMHPDHERGLIDAAGKPVFSNAELVVHEDEVAFWRDDAAMSRASEEGKGDFALARAALDAYADRLKTVKNDDVLPGVTAFPTPGHTPGHTAWHIESGKDSLLVWGDIVHFPGIQFAIPEASVVFDIDAQAAAASRRRMLSMAASEGMQVAGIHHDFPSVGHVVPDGSGFRFQHRIWSPLV